MGPMKTGPFIEVDFYIELDFNIVKTLYYGNDKTNRNITWESLY